jgi:hypothetical protein
MNSPLENVRELLMLVLLFAFREGLGGMKPVLRERLTELLKPLLTNCMQSTDYSERLLGIKLLALLVGLGSEHSGPLLPP